MASKIVRDPSELLAKQLAEAGVLDDDGEAAVVEASKATPATAQKAVAAKGKVDSAKYEESYTWSFSYTADNGKVYAGTLTNNIMTLRQRRLLGVTRAQMSAGVPYSAMDPGTNNLIGITAHLAISLQKPLPEWLNFDTLHDEEVIFKIWEEVDSHESTFRGPRTAS